MKIFAWLTLPSIVYFIYRKMRIIRWAVNVGRWRHPGVDLTILGFVLLMAALLVYIITGG